jgi:hypothetical protein
VGPQILEWPYSSPSLSTHQSCLIYRFFTSSRTFAFVAISLHLQAWPSNAKFSWYLKVASQCHKKTTITGTYSYVVVPILHVNLVPGQGEYVHGV